MLLEKNIFFLCVAERRAEWLDEPSEHDVGLGRLHVPTLIVEKLLPDLLV